MSNCPCGSVSPYDRCCGPYHTGEKEAETAETLMRSRYTAFTMANPEFLQQTQTAEMNADFDPQDVRNVAQETDWQRLEILNVVDGGKTDITGEIEFIAHYRHMSQKMGHHELAAFRKEKGAWLCSESRIDPKKPPVTVTKVGRNEPCPCGSGKKYKKCCGG